MPHFRDDAHTDPAADVTRELYDSSESLSVEDVRPHHEPGQEPTRTDSLRGSRNSSLSSTHRCELVLEASLSDLEAGAVRTCHSMDPSDNGDDDDTAAAFIVTHLEEEDRAQLLLTEEEERRCFFRAFTAVRTLIRIREADTHSNPAVDRLVYGTRSAEQSDTDVSGYVQQLLTHARARRAQEAAAQIPWASHTDRTRKDQTATGSSLHTRGRASPRRHQPADDSTTFVSLPPHFSQAALKKAALRDALLSTLSELDRGGPHGGAFALTASESPFPADGIADHTSTRDDTSRLVAWRQRAPHTLPITPPRGPGGVQNVSRVASPRAWRQYTPIQIDTEWNISTNPHSISAASRGLDVSQLADASADLGPSLASSSSPRLYRDNAASRQRRASSAARLTAATGCKGKRQAVDPRAASTSTRTPFGAKQQDPPNNGHSSLGKSRTRYKGPLRAAGLARTRAEGVLRDEGQERSAVEKAYWESLNHLLHLFIVEGTALLRNTPSHSTGIERPRSLAATPHTAARPASLGDSRPTSSSGAPETSSSTENCYHCACLHASLSGRLAVVSVDTNCPHDVRVGDRVAAVEGSTLHQLADVSAAERLLGWGSGRDQYWTLVRGGQKRVVLHIMSPC